MTENLSTITVDDFLKHFATTCQRVILKDSFNGREYTRPDRHLHKRVNGCFPRIVSRDGSYAYAALVLWVEHDFNEKREVRK